MAPTFFFHNSIRPYMEGRWACRVEEPMRLLAERYGARYEIATGALRLEPSNGHQHVFLRYRAVSAPPREFLRRLVDRRVLFLLDIDDRPQNWKEFAVDHHLGVKACHAIQTSSEEIARVLRPFNPEVKVFGNEIGELPPLRDAPAGKTTTLFFGAFLRQGDWPEIVAPLNEALRRHSAELAVRVVNDRRFFEALETPNKQFWPLVPHATYVEILRGCDIALLPLKETPNNVCKSDLKFLECAACGVVVLASPTIYGNSVIDGVTGCLYETPEQFAVKLERLIRDRVSRRMIAEAAYAYVREKRLLRERIHERHDWYVDLARRYDALTRALAGRLPRTKRRPAPNAR